MHRFFYIEGPDGAGKSSIARTLVGKDAIWHNGPDAELSSAELFEKYEIYIRMAGTQRRDQAVAIDRLHWSEYIYGPLLRGWSRLSFDQVRELDNLVESLGGTKVYVHANDATLEERCVKRGEHLVTRSVRRASRNLYSRYCNDWDITINTTRMWN